MSEKLSKSECIYIWMFNTKYKYKIYTRCTLVLKRKKHTQINRIQHGYSYFMVIVKLFSLSTNENSLYIFK